MSSPSSQDEGLIPNSQPGRSRCVSRSPHPYHRVGAKYYGLPDYDDRSSPSQWARVSSESGTEADDENAGVLRRLPPPPLRTRKGLLSGWIGDGDRDSRGLASAGSQPPWPTLSNTWRSPGGTAKQDRKLRKKRDTEILRRLLETLLLVSVGVVVLLEEEARSIAWVWKRELLTHVIIIAGLYTLYLLRARSSVTNLRSLEPPVLFIPSSFDPAPLLYPVVIPLLVSLSISQHSPSLVLPNILLSLSSLPSPTIPLYDWRYGPSSSHWMVTLIPLIVSENLSRGDMVPKPLAALGLDPETMTLIFPLHQALIPTLDFLLTTSILPAELQLLTIALINLLLFAKSPQAEILKSLLWLGGVCIFVSCRHILRWEVTLARIPYWKFRRHGTRLRKGFLGFINYKLCHKINGSSFLNKKAPDRDTSTHPRTANRSRTRRQALAGEYVSVADNMAAGGIFWQRQYFRRRHTISGFEMASAGRARTTPSGRRKRSIAPELSSFLSMTVFQAKMRKWLYALYIYAAVLAIIMVPVRKYVSVYALYGQEPFGWALGYLFGNLRWFRFKVLMWNLEYWVPLPEVEASGTSYRLGWLERLRKGILEPANTRLLICIHCSLIILAGVGAVIRLSAVTEVDTRRKVFHGMMVLMFVPSIYMDPVFCGLALALVLSIFLLLDLFRASQLPPVSRPLTHFLAPYIDGRDYRGPVIISHIFLLIGCSIPLWLSLANIPRTGSGPWAGWDVPSRDISMVSGVICVGMGDAAASLFGRRFGRHKWLWVGGKSIEGSVAFAATVFCGLMAAWIRFSRAELSATDPGCKIYRHWLSAVGKASLAAGGASMTEAILTGCNDNVVVPIVLWLLVRGLRL